MAALVLDGVADLGIALSGGTLKGLVRAPLPSDDVICVTGPNHRIVRLKRAKIADLRDCLIALNAWATVPVRSSRSCSRLGSMTGASGSAPTPARPWRSQETMITQLW